METGKVYSYLRFSAAKQAAGSSIERQAEYARKWAEANGRVLDESLSMKDEGLSAYHQKHIKSGALGVFLEAINDGKIPAGSVLIVEGLDRLSRAEPMVAQPQLAQIINAGITVVTVADGKTYSRESLKSNPMDLLYSLLVMIRAHEESETKSKRVAAAVLTRCQGWMNGTYRGRVPGGKDPSWVRWTGAGFELKEEETKSMQLAIDLYIQGNGPVRILQHFKGQGLPLLGQSRASNVDAAITKQPILFIGHRPITSCGESFLLENYYPPILGEEKYAQLVSTIARRRQAPRSAGGKSNYPSLFCGAKLASCGVCGENLIAQNSLRQLDSGPSLYRWVRCAKCALTSSLHTKKFSSAASMEPIERALLDYCADQINLDALHEGDDGTAKLNMERAGVCKKLDDTERKMAKILDAALELDEGLPQLLLRRVKEYEADIAKLKDQLTLLDAQLSVSRQGSNTSTSKEWQALREGVLALDYDARMKCRQLFIRTFRVIQIYFQGARPDTPATQLDILLVSHTGTTRWLRIDRKTGKRIKGGDRSLSSLPEQ